MVRRDGQFKTSRSVRASAGSGAKLQADAIEPKPCQSTEGMVSIRIQELRCEVDGQEAPIPRIPAIEQTMAHEIGVCKSRQKKIGADGPDGRSSLDCRRIACYPLSAD